MAGYAAPGFDTLALHAGSAPDPVTGARAVPLHLSTSFVFESAEHAASLFNLERPGHVYSRLSNPTTAVLEERIAALEGGVAGIAVASGQAALHLGLATIAGAGSHVLASRALYGGSQNLLHYTMRRFGIDTTFVKPGDIDGWRAATTKDFFSFDGGKRFDGDALFDLIKANHAKGTVYVWTVNDPKVDVACDTALITYVNTGSVTNVALDKGMTFVLRERGEVIEVSCIGKFVQIDDGQFGVGSQRVSHEMAANESASTGDQ